jgi:hypothetical protein
MLSSQESRVTFRISLSNAIPAPGHHFFFNEADAGVVQHILPDSGIPAGHPFSDRNTLREYFLVDIPINRCE